MFSFDSEYFITIFSVGKEKKPGYRWGVFARTADGIVVGLYGMPARNNDLGVLYESGYLSQRDINEFTFGDGAFMCMSCFLLFFLSLNQLNFD